MKLKSVPCDKFLTLKLSQFTCKQVILKSRYLPLNLKGIIANNRSKTSSAALEIVQGYKSLGFR